MVDWAGMLLGPAISMISLVSLLSSDAHSNWRVFLCLTDELDAAVLLPAVVEIECALFDAVSV